MRSCWWSRQAFRSILLPNSSHTRRPIRFCSRNHASNISRVLQAGHRDRYRLYPVRVASRQEPTCLVPDGNSPIADKMRGGAGRTRTNNQTIMGGGYVRPAHLVEHQAHQLPTSCPLLAQFIYRNLWNIPPRCPGSLWLYVRELHHLGPLLGFLGDELAEVGGIQRQRRNRRNLQAGPSRLPPQGSR